MRTFQEFITWVQQTQQEMNTLWDRAGNIEGIYKGNRGQIQIYDKLVKERFGTGNFFSGFHPSTDNLQIFTGSSIDDTLVMLDELGYKVERSESGVRCSSFWSSFCSRDGVTSDYHRLEHNQGVITLQIYRDPASLLFYFDQKFDGEGGRAVAKFTDRNGAEHYCSIPQETEPSTTFNVETTVLINPYGHHNRSELRLKERTMENRIAELMESIIKRNVPAIYQTRGTAWYCVINQPRK